MLQWCREEPDGGDVTLTEYVSAALAQADYEQLPDGTWYAHIPGFPGLWATGATVEACREDLRSALEDWILIGLRLGHPLPVVNGIDLTVRDVA